MLDGMPSSQLTEWMAFYRLEHPEEPAEYRAGMIVSAIYNTVPRAKGQPKKRYQPHDFFPSRAPKEPMTAEEMLARVVEINQALGGDDRRKEKQ